MPLKESRIPLIAQIFQFCNKLLVLLVGFTEIYNDRAVVAAAPFLDGI